MIIQNEKTTVQMSGVLETSNFEIKTDDGKMFHILSNLYSNPLGAVVRELSTNCIDGHKIAGNPELPFDIILPGKMNMGNFITFRDYGPGMSHEVVTSIFTTFGQSTKVDSNVETGCLGLGSKSPLAITESFTVTSVNNGIKTTYSVSKDGQKKPLLAKFGSIQTEEANGLVVTVPLSSSHRDNVEHEIINQLEHFKIKPNVFYDETKIDMEWKDNSNFFELTPEIFIRAEKFQKFSQIIQGEIGYSFNSTTLLESFNELKDDDKDINSDKFLVRDGLELTSATIKILNEFFKNFELNIYMPMGTVTFAPSREELIYDNLTCKNIMDEVLKAVKLIDKNYKDLHKFVENRYQYNQLRNIYQFKNQNIIKLPDNLKRFLNCIGFNFISNFKSKYVMQNGEIASTKIGKIQDYIEFPKFLEIKHMFYDKQCLGISSKTMIVGKKAARFHIISGQIHDYIKKEDYKKIKVVIVSKETKFIKKHINNYLLFTNEGQTSYEDQTVVLMVKMLESDIKDTIAEDFSKYCGLSKDNVLLFEDVLTISEKFIKDGKAPTKIAESRPKTLRKTTLGHMSNLRHWQIIETTTKEIQEDLVGLYVKTFNNRFIFDNSKLKEQYPSIFEIMNTSYYKEDGVTNLLALLNACGCKIDYEIPVYHGHERNFKKTKLVKFEDFIVSVLAKSRYQNAWHALNLETKTFSVTISDNERVINFFNNMSFVRGTSLSKEKVCNSFQKMYNILKNEYKSYDQWFYLNNHPINQFYDKYINLKHDGTMLDIVRKCGLLDNEIRRKDVEEALDIKFNYVFLDEEFDKLYNKYKFEYLSCAQRYRYSYRSEHSLLSDFISDINKINTIDYLEKNFPDLKIFAKISVQCDEEDECDSVINRHDYIESLVEEEVELVAE